MCSTQECVCGFSEQPGPGGLGLPNSEKVRKLYRGESDWTTLKESLDWRLKIQREPMPISQSKSKPSRNLWSLFI